MTQLWLGGGATDVGKVRQQNEDQFHVDNDIGLYVVCDGMGGHAAGDVASTLAVQSAVAAIARHRQSIDAARSGSLAPAALIPHIEAAVHEASQTVYQTATSERGKAGMGCTLSLLLAVGSTAIVAHVGDSRVYLWRNGSASQLTQDHTYTAELVRAGVIRPEEAEEHPFASVLLRSIGTQPAVQVDTLALDVLPGDRFLLCSDGLTRYVHELSWLAAELGKNPLGNIASDLVDHAREAGGSDNITVVIVEAQGAEAAPPTQPAVSQLQARLAGTAGMFLLQGLSFDMRSRLLATCKALEHAPGDVVFPIGEPRAALSFVAAGSYRLTHADGSTTILQPGAAVGLPLLFEPRPTRAQLEALQPGQLLVLERDALWALIRARPWLGIGILGTASRRLSRELHHASPDGREPWVPALE